MDNIKKLLNDLLEKKISIDEAEKQLKVHTIERIGELAKLDTTRKIRTGIPEAIYAQNKDSKLVIEIINQFLIKNKYAIVSRFNQIHETMIRDTFEKSELYKLEINDLANIAIIREKSFTFEEKNGKVGIITAGSSDVRVAEEAKIIAESMGCKVITSYDVGIAGIHRLFEPLSNMIEKEVHVIIVFAGMEGTLPGVVAALVDVPVIGVPISSGYGLGEKGIGALTTMLQSCSPGLLVVNIDNGFGAGASAALIANMVGKS